MRARSRDALKIDPVISYIWDPYAPIEGIEYFNMPAWLPEFRKRAAAKRTKKRMMNDLVQVERMKKRTSKAALSLMLQSKQDPEQMTEEEYSCLVGK
ncbi:jg5131 [Pararge aegeria aegeria]|uniref:Jg5131 protein n=2 Tax=Pararge aegeria TaxID=116150 RepID=A0A8S4S180_9NEOP|nr:jg5131 [Pararge aegeria aegeria]